MKKQVTDSERITALEENLDNTNRILAPCLAMVIVMFLAIAIGLKSDGDKIRQLESRVTTLENNIETP